MNISKELKENGYAVVENVLSRDEIEQARDLFWEWLDSLGTGIIRDDSSTWKNDNWPGDIRGFLGTNRISQSKFVWHLRSKGQIKDIFAKIWGTNDLLCSMDYVICWRPWWLQDEENWDPEVEGLHVDQNPVSKRGFHCVQGMLNLYDVTEETGGLEIVPRSHTDEIQDYLANYYGKNRGDWCPFPKADKKYYNHIQNNEAKLITVPAGSFILWDSRLIHAGKVGSGKELNEEDDKDTYISELTRLSVPICMMPREKVSDRVQKQRAMAFFEGKVMSHWVDKGDNAHEAIDSWLK